MPPMDASTPVCPMIAPNAPLSHIAPRAKLRSLRSIYPSSLATVLLLLPSAPGRTAAHLACIVFHYTAFAGFLGPSQCLHASARTSRYYHLHSLSDRHAPCPPIHTSRVREQESKHPADFSKQPDDGAHDDDDDDDEGPRPSGSGGASSARQPSGSSGGTMGGNEFNILA
ncbi:uncharacterized protein FOMMEDRAFT_154398 [Fomitiporia mediterranea MF3/22]|uniref:uncharacterized protein n=1 Tax=Fomitiporia mediterranea (strain MF3/22) TaxID=694068 RepID=UPI0004407F02|nr:uncharacterized protein FOMMEDRAFT_154398 [Fomitiporia mediterranea MF3/22]EJD05184.1 hypothetical protein FOMMEDRAFT_154398 [Fomitiporia mediterranea MF3/22]